MGEQKNNDNSQLLVQTALKICQAQENACAAADAKMQALVNSSIENAAQGGQNDSNAEKKGFWDTAKKTAGSIKDGWVDSFTNRSAGVHIADYIQDVDQAPSDEEIEVETAKINKLSLSAQGKDSGVPQVTRTLFHATPTMPFNICTSNAILRCSFGLTFGPLTVLPFRRVSVGAKIPNPVATVTDFIPFTNIPSFGLCFNILNPAVAAATAVATAAKGGVFTLTPMPCVPAATPWIPTTKNLCGGMPLLTQLSCCLCWGIGSINIIHCGQGVEPGLANYFRVPGDWVATAKGWAEALVNVAGSVAGLVAVGPKAAQAAQAAQAADKLNKINKLNKIAKGFDIASDVGDAANVGLSLAEGKPGDAAASATSLLGKYGGKGGKKLFSKKPSNTGTATSEIASGSSKIAHEGPQTITEATENAANQAMKEMKDDAKKALEKAHAKEVGAYGLGAGKQVALSEEGSTINEYVNGDPEVKDIDKYTDMYQKYVSEQNKNKDN